jgi:hypothetical protein
MNSRAELNAYSGKPIIDRGRTCQKIDPRADVGGPPNLPIDIASAGQGQSYGLSAR